MSEEPGSAGEATGLGEPVHLPGGSGGVWRQGDTVLRPTGPWTPAVHALLDHLAARGLDGVPRVLGTDDGTHPGGREVLSFLPGSSPDPNGDPVADAALAGAAAWLRRYHETVADFRPVGERWRGGDTRLAPDELLCHNDPGSYNWVLDGECFVGMIDWDQAGPGHPIDDLAFLCWTGVPLFREAGEPAEAARRIRLAADAYGGIDPAGLLDAVGERLSRSVTRIRAGIELGDPGMLALAAVGEPERTAGRIAEFAGRAPRIRQLL